MLVERYLKDPANERLPLLITLRAFAKAMTAQQLINDALLEQYRLPFVGSAFQVFQEMNRRGKLLLILDGFDEMARKPVLVELLLAALDEVSADVLENPAQVYLYATNRLLLRNIDTKRTFTTTADKLYFLCELAWEMIESGELRIHYTDIPERIKTYFGERIKDQHELDTWDYDLRNQTLLHRDAAGYYEFAHKSLAEYFVAFKFAAELGCLALPFAQTYCEANGQPCKMPIKEKDISGLAEIYNREPSAGDVVILSFLTEMTEKDKLIETQLLRKRVKALLWFFVVALVLSGATAFLLK